MGTRSFGGTTFYTSPLQKSCNLCSSSPLYQHSRPAFQIATYFLCARNPTAFPSFGKTTALHAATDSERLGRIMACSRVPALVSTSCHVRFGRISLNPPLTSEAHSLSIYLHTPCPIPGEPSPAKMHLLLALLYVASLGLLGLRLAHDSPVIFDSQMRLAFWTVKDRLLSMSAATREMSAFLHR